MRFLRFLNLNNRKRILPLVLLAVILIFLIYGVQDAAGNADRLQHDLTMRAISRALADCYAIEGHYPPNMQYLYDNYHVRVDEERFFVFYSIFAPNITPTVKLVDRSQ